MSEPDGSSTGQPVSGQQGAGTPGQSGQPAAPQFVTIEQLNGALHARAQRTEERIAELIEQRFKGFAGAQPAAPTAAASGGASATKQGDSELLALQQRLDAATKQAADERALRIRHEKTVTLRSALASAHCSDVDSALDILAQRGDLKQRTAADGSIEWVGTVADEYGGTREAPVAEVVSDFMRRRPLFAPARGAGSGARGTPGSPGGRVGPSWEGKRLDELTPDELAAMPREERSKARNAASGVQVGIFGAARK